MKNHLISLIAFSLIWIGAWNQVASGSDYARFVNPFIGTASGGHCFPGATVPFGFVQASPDTGTGGWDYCSGYRYEDTNIMGFSQTHLSGTGCPELGDILLFPFTGKVQQSQYQSAFTHQRETARPGYYAVDLLDYGIRAELTASQRCAFHRYTFKNAKEGRLLVDLRSGMVGDKESLDRHVLRSEFHIEDPQTVSGCRITRGWGGERYTYFVMRFAEPMVATNWLSTESNRNQRVVLTFRSESNLVIQAQISLSTVDVSGARANLAAELNHWDFEATAASTYSLWNKYLSKVKAESDRGQLEAFYTALYHTGMAPNNIADVDGRYRGPDNKLYSTPTKAYYSTLSLWDVHRASMPLYTIIRPDLINGIADTMLRHFEAAGYLPMWTLWAHDNHCMIGNPSIPVLAEAYLKGILDTSAAQKAYEAMRVSSTVNHEKSDWDIYLKYGYLPTDLVKEESVSRTLEQAFDDSCVAEMAKTMGKTNDAAYFAKRSTFYRNVFDPSTGLMRGRKSDGSWVTPFDTMKISHAGDAGGDYTEANAWQYTWHVQQCPQDLIRLFGGDKPFVAQLDKLFSLPSTVTGDGATVDVTGLIGQYVQGNEPSHHVAYLYNYAGMPWKTQERVHQIMTTLYNNTPGGICGNDDCGQMSAWYLFSAMGFYPVNPVARVYVIGTPALDRVEIDVGEGRTFTSEVVRKHAGDIYIEHVERNGKIYPCSYILHEDLMGGGAFKFFLASKPNCTFGKAPATRPQAARE